MSTEPVVHSAPAGPVHPVKVDPVFGVAETIAVSPGLYVPAPLTVPEPVPAVVKVRVALMRENVAVQLLSAVMLTDPLLHSPASVPLQPSKWDPKLAVAETFAVWPKSYVPAPFTVPEPVPAVFSFNVKVLSAKFAVQLLFEFINTEPVPHSDPNGPVHPVKVDPESGVAETFAVSPGLYRPAPLTVPEPFPAVFNESVKVVEFTVRVVVPLTVPIAALIVVVPALRPMALPLALIPAFPVSLLVQTTALAECKGPFTATGLDEPLFVPSPSWP
jgi:hypothetical protein